MTKFLYEPPEEDKPPVATRQDPTESVEERRQRMMQMSFEELQEYLGYDDSRYLKFLIVALREASPMNEMNMVKIMGDIIAQQLRRGGRI